MKKNFSFMGLLLSLLLLAILPSCSKDASANMNDLLSSTPSDASVVVAINLEEFLKKADCKYSDSKFVPGDKLAKILNNNSNSSDEPLLDLLQGDSGIDPSVALIFVEGQDVYLTGCLSNPDNFKSTIEKNKNASFSKSDNVESCSNIAVKDSQFWIRLSHNNTIETSEISRFANLSDKLSFLANSYADELAKMDKDLNGWANISGLINVTDLEFSQKSMLRMALSTLFDDPEDLTFSVEFEDGEMEAEIKLLNSKGKNAKFLYPTEKIDISKIKELGSSADMIYAAAIPHKLITQLTKDTGSKGISLMNVFLQCADCIDGTCAVISNQNSTSGIISTNDKNSGSLIDLLKEMGVSAKKSNNAITFGEGGVSGDLTISEVASKFKGASAGFVFSASQISNSSSKKLKNASIMLEPDGNSVSFKIKAESYAEKQNFILTLLEVLAEN